MKKSILFLVLFLVAGCADKVSVTPESAVKVTENTSKVYKVDKLFTVDGISVYRFYDRSSSGAVYFTKKEAYYEYTESRARGKGVYTEYHKVQSMNID